MKKQIRNPREKCSTQSGLLSVGLIFWRTILANEWNYETQLFQFLGEFFIGEVNDCEWLDSQDSIIVINIDYFFV